MKNKSPKEVVIYQAKNGALEFRGDFERDTIWATQKQIASLFGVTTQNITIHLKRIFEEGELEQKSTCKESLQVQKEGNRQVKRLIKEYNLDVMIAVGYRVNSVLGTRFRIWATKTLKQHLLDGYTIDKKRIGRNYKKFLQAVADIKTLSAENANLKNADVLELVQAFAGTWFSLDAYDKQEFPQKGLTKKTLKIQAQDLYEDISAFKATLIKKGEATELFAQEKSEKNLSGILGNVFQSAFGQDVYPSIEEKAAHLLYFTVKNHPFNDGNKRTGAFSFIWLLQKAGLNFQEKITAQTLTALTLLIADSAPKEKDKMIGLVLLLLKK